MSIQISYQRGDLIEVEIRYQWLPGRIIGFEQCRGWIVLYATEYKGMDGVMHATTGKLTVPAKRLRRRTA